MAPRTKQRKTKAKATRRVTISKVLIAERRGMVVQLKMQGGTWDQIAEQLIASEHAGVPPKYDRASAYKDFQAEMEALVALNADKAASLKRFEIERLDELIAAVWPYAKQADIASIAAFLKLQDKRDKYLGLFPITTGSSQPRGASNEGGTLSDGTVEQPRITEIVVNLNGVSPIPAMAGDVIDVTPNGPLLLSEHTGETLE